MSTIALVPPPTFVRDWIRLGDTIVERGDRGLFHAPPEAVPELLGKGFSRYLDKLHVGSGGEPLAKRAAAKADLESQIAAVTATAAQLPHHQASLVAKCVARARIALAQDDLGGAVLAFAPVNKMAAEQTAEDRQHAVMRDCLSRPRRGWPGPSGAGAAP